MELPGAFGASGSDLGKGRGALWLFVAAVGLLQPVAGKPEEVCQCDFGNSIWEKNMDIIIARIRFFRDNLHDENDPSMRFIRNYKCPNEATQTDWKCRPEQSVVSAVCSLQALDATTRRLVGPGAGATRNEFYSHNDDLRHISMRFAEAVSLETEQQRKVCEDQRVSAEKVTALQQFEARRAEAQAKEEAKKAEAEGAQRSHEAWQARAEAAENGLKRAKESAKRAEQLLKESQTEAEAKGTRCLIQFAVPGSWRYVLACLLLLVCFCALVPRRFGKLLASFLCPARDRTVDAGDRQTRPSEELVKAVRRLREAMVEEFDTLKDQLCPKQQEAKVPSTAGEQLVLQLADQLADNGKALLQLKGVMEEHLDAMKVQLCRSRQDTKPSAVEGTTHPTEVIAMPQADDASEVWSHTSWVEISRCEALAANSLPKISAGGII